MGAAFVDKIDEWLATENLSNIATDCNYQLNIENVAEISDKDIVIFVDASTEDISNFVLTKVKPSGKVNFTMHAVTPAFVVDLCSQIFNRTPKTYLLHIRGYEWDFKEGLSQNAEKNLNDAIRFIKDRLKDLEFEGHVQSITY